MTAWLDEIGGDGEEQKMDTILNVWMTGRVRRKGWKRIFNFNFAKESEGIIECMRLNSIFAVAWICFWAVREGLGQCVWWVTIGAGTYYIIEVVLDGWFEFGYIFGDKHKRCVPLLQNNSNLLVSEMFEETDSWRTGDLTELSKMCWKIQIKQVTVCRS